MSRLWLCFVASLVAVVGAVATTPAAASAYGYGDAALTYDAPVEVVLDRTLGRATTPEPVVELAIAHHAMAGSSGNIYDLSATFVAPRSPGARFVAGSDGVIDTVGKPDSVTLGRYPDYLDSAAADGSRTFIVGDAWEAMANRPGRFGGTGEGSEIWIRNTRFLDDAVARGSEIRLASDPFAPAKAGSFFLREISYLEKLGYRVKGTIWCRDDNGSRVPSSRSRPGRMPRI